MTFDLVHDIAEFFRSNFSISVELQVAEINRRWPETTQEELEQAAKMAITQLEADNSKLRAETARLLSEVALLNAPTAGWA